MNIIVTKNFAPLAEMEMFTVEDWGRVGRAARELIIARTQAGRDENDQSFAPYSPQYAEAKAEAGASSSVDLTVSGEMLRGITVEPDKDGVTLSFNA